MGWRSDQRFRAILAGATLAAVIALEPAPAHAKNEFSFGIGVGVFAFDDGVAYEGRALSYLSGLGADTGDSRRADWAVVPVLTQSWKFHENLGVEVRERFWQSAARGRFDANPGLDFRFARSVVPFTLSLAASVANNGNDAGVSLLAGPGLYVVSSDLRGFLGTEDSIAARPGVLVSGGFFVRVSESLYVRGDVCWDWFDLPRTSELLKDGGNGGGFTVSGILEYRM
ncbi:MAG: hypothetical protein HY897_23430 [Deltaproteobacteria bacterium]|nr:hypothetical protein [Deltaproteobacteria bacterium]